MSAVATRPPAGFQPTRQPGSPRLLRKATDLLSAFPASKERNDEAPSCHLCGRGHYHRCEHRRAPVGTGVRDGRDGEAVGAWQWRASAWRRQQRVHPELCERAPMSRGSVPAVLQRQALANRDSRRHPSPHAERVADGAADQEARDEAGMCLPPGTPLGSRGLVIGRAQLIGRPGPYSLVGELTRPEAGGLYLGSRSSACCRGGGSWRCSPAEDEALGDDLRCQCRQAAAQHLRAMGSADADRHATGGAHGATVRLAFRWRSAALFLRNDVSP